jgi:hypothetical protein
VLWPHGTAELVSTLVLGAVILVASLLAPRRPKLRYAATIASIALLLSVWIVPPTARVSFWNALVVSFAVFFLSLTEPEGRMTRGRGAPAAR